MIYRGFKFHDKRVPMQSDKITVHAYQWQIIDGQASTESTELRAWCLDTNSKAHLLRFNGFPVLAHLELPTRVDGRPFTWSSRSADRIYKYLYNALQRKGSSPTGCLYKTMIKLYYLQQSKTPFLLLAFRNLKAMRDCKTLLQAPREIKGFCRSIKLALHETKVNQVRKLLTQQNCKMSQWFSINAIEVNPEDRISIDTIKEYIVDWKTMTALDLELVTHPGILMFDIESYSHNPKAFPDAWNAGDFAYMISCIYRRHGTEEGKRNICITYGISSVPNEGDEFIFVNNEEEMIRTFERIVRELDPEIVSGYNIHGFDYIYLDKRLQRIGLSWGIMGRIRNEKAILKSMSWQSSGYGHNDINILQMSGRISVDMLPLVKRLPMKLPKYNLDTVAMHYLKIGKDPVSAQDMFRIVKCQLLLENVVEQLRLPTDDKKKIIYQYRDPKVLKKWIVTRNGELAYYDEVEVEQLIDLVDYVNDKMKMVADYCIKDSIVVMKLFNKLDIWIYLIQLSNITGVTPMELFTRGQQARGLSIVYNQATHTGYVVDSRLFPKESFTGGFVGKPDPGVYENSICLDFKSLYPNIIRAYNICWTTYVPPWMDHLIPDEMCNIIQWEDEIELKGQKRGETIEQYDGETVTNEKGKKFKIIRRRLRFLKACGPNGEMVGPNGRIRYKQGLLPVLVGNLIDERNKVRKAQKAFNKNSVEWVIHEQRQLGMKVTANSMYGLLGVTGEGGVLPLPEAAMAVTAYGRQLIHFCNDYIAEKYNGYVVYNDTDSTMVQIPGVKNGMDANRWGKKLEDELSAIFPDPLYLEFEKAGRQFCIAKKNYVFWIYDQNGNLPYDNGDPEYMAKGIPLARRDKAKWQRDIVKYGLDMIIKLHHHQDFLDMVIDNVVRTLRGEVPWEDFIIIRGLGSHYKVENFFMKLFAEELQKLGRPAQPGDRLEYVIVKTSNPDEKLGRRMRDPETFTRRLGTKAHEPVDYVYYIEHFLMDCMEKYWGIAYKDVIAESMERSSIIDYNNVLVDLRYEGFENKVVAALASNDNDPERAVLALLQTPLKNKTIMARRKYISGRDVFDCRMNSKPIKMLLKGYKIGRLEEVVRSLASPELYEKLYPITA
jgi:DNA polymerase elongation subunit (family B)